MRKIQSLTIDEQTVLKLEKFAKDNLISKSRAAEKILSRFLSVEYPVELTSADSVYEKVVIPKSVPLTKEEYEEQRAFERSMVNRGEWHQGFLEEPPRCELAPHETAIYNTPDGKVRDGRLFEGETEKPPMAPTPLLDARREREKKEREEMEKEGEKEETQQEMEDREFDESLAMSIAEKE